MIDQTETTVSKYSDDPRVEVAAKALAWAGLTEKGRATCDWVIDFSERERNAFRAKAIIVMEAIYA